MPAGMAVSTLKFIEINLQMFPNNKSFIRPLIYNLGLNVVGLT